LGDSLFVCSNKKSAKNATRGISPSSLTANVLFNAPSAKRDISEKGASFDCGGIATSGSYWIEFIKRVKAALL
jgi:hypothetical protein